MLQETNEILSIRPRRPSFDVNDNKIISGEDIIPVQNKKNSGTLKLKKVYFRY